MFVGAWYVLFFIDFLYFFVPAPFSSCGMPLLSLVTINNPLPPPPPDSKLYYSTPELSVTILDALPGLSLSPEAAAGGQTLGPRRLCRRRGPNTCPWW